MDPERERLELLARESRCLVDNLTTLRPVWVITRNRAVARCERRDLDLRNLDALIMCDNLDPSDLHELSERC